MKNLGVSNGIPFQDLEQSGLVRFRTNLKLLRQRQNGFI